jgi:hypothetical protein
LLKFQEKLEILTNFLEKPKKFILIQSIQSIQSRSLKNQISIKTYFGIKIRPHNFTKSSSQRNERKKLILSNLSSELNRRKNKDLKFNLEKSDDCLGIFEKFAWK